MLLGIRGFIDPCAPALMDIRPSRRGAAVRARRSLNFSSAPSTSQSGGGTPSRGVPSSLLSRVSKIIKLVQKHRRERHLKLKELSRADLDKDEGIIRDSSVCPVCQVRVTVDDVAAHVDACLASASAQTRANGAGVADDLAADGLEEYEMGGETRIRIAGAVDFRGK